MSSTSTLRVRAPLPSFARSLTTYGYAQSKALVYRAHGDPAQVLSLYPSSLSAPHSDLVKLRFLVSPINPSDINTIEGTYPIKPQLSSDLNAFVGGAEGVAEVLAAGQGASHLKRGDWVLPVSGKWKTGSWRTNAQVEGSTIFAISRERVHKAFAGTVSVNPATALVMLRSSGLGEGDWFIQNGANSAVGSMLSQIGRILCINSIAVVREREDPADTEQLREKMLQLGATVCVTEKELAQPDFRDRVSSWTSAQPRGVQLALNCTGGRSVLAISKVLGEGASVVTYGAMAKQPVPPVPFSLMVFRAITYSGFWLSRWAMQQPELYTQYVQDLLQWHREGQLSAPAIVPITWSLSTSETQLKEHVDEASRGFKAGKSVFVFGDDTG